MKSAVALLIFIATIATASAARADDDSRRKTGLFGGFGLSRIMATVEQPGVSTTLRGWGNAVEGGMDFSFTNSFGATVSLEIQETDLRNDYRANDYLDQTTLKSKSVRAGFYYKNLTLGGGYRQLVVDMKTVSATNGAESAHLEGAGTFGFGSFSIIHRGFFRGSLEVQANSTDMSGFKYSDYTVGLRAYLLLGGLMD